MKNEFRALLLCTAAGLLLPGCAAQSGLTDKTPTIAQTIGDDEQPSAEVLPIIASEPIAADPQKAVENYRALLKLAPDRATREEAQRRLADLQVQIDDAQGATANSDRMLSEAVNLYNKLLKENPDGKDNDRILYQLARAQQNRGQTEQAIDTLHQLTEQLPESPLVGDARFRRAELLFYLRRYSDAEPEYKRVMDLKGATPFFEPAQYKYGWSLYKQSKYDQAIATFFDVLDRELPAGEPSDPETALAGVNKTKVDLVRDSLRVINLSLATMGGGPALSEYLEQNGDPRFTPLLYAALGEALLDKRRYTDAAGAFAAYIKRYPTSPLAPSFQSRVIAADEAGGFGDLVLQEKERYAKTYDPDAPYWQGKPATPEVMATLRKHLEDLAKYFHAQAQQGKAELAAAADASPDAVPDAAKLADNQAAFLTAAGWYRRIITLYPDDKQLPDINFLLGDTLLDGGKTLDAAREYERTAYGYKPHRRSGEAAYASVQAYEKYAGEVPPAQRPAALKTAIDAGLRLADKFDGHPELYPVLTQVAQDLFELKDYDKTIEVASRVLKAPLDVDVNLRRVSWSVTADAQFAKKNYAEAEKAYSEELKLTSVKIAERDQIIEQLAASIYKQGEAARDADDLKAAAKHFLRVGTVTPTAKIRATAEYDGAAALIALEDWGQAAKVLEDFRSRFPKHELEADVDKKLAVAYQKDNKPREAAGAFARIARRASEDAKTRREAAWLSATLYDKADSVPDAQAAYHYYIQTFPKPFDRSLDARSRLVEYARANHDDAQLKSLLTGLVSADQTAGADRSERSRTLAAQASLDLGRMAADRTRELKLTLPIKQSLPEKKAQMQEAIRWFGKAADYGYAETTTAATYELGTLYREFGRALLDSERPRNLDALAQEQYQLLLEEQAYPFEEQAISTHESNLRRIRTGLFNDWIARSLKALADIAPAKYGKREQGEELYETLD